MVKGVFSRQSPNHCSFEGLPPNDYAGEHIKAKKRWIRLIYVTVSNSAVAAAEAFRRGASGYVLKQDDFAGLVAAVRRVVRGGSYLSSGIDRDEFNYRCLRSDYSSGKKLTS